MNRRNLNRNQNYKRKNRRNDDSLKEEKKEQIEYFKETFVKAKELGNFHAVLEEVNLNVPDKIAKSPIIVTHPT